VNRQPLPCREILQPRFQLTDNRLHLLIGEGIVDALAVKTKDEPEIVSLIALGEDIGPHPSPPKLHPQHCRQVEGIFEGGQGTNELASEFESVFADFLLHGQ